MTCLLAPHQRDVLASNPSAPSDFVLGLHGPLQHNHGWWEYWVMAGGRSLSCSTHARGAMQILYILEGTSTPCAPRVAQ
eukprot:scaffold42531_cov61-Phaeocystis_antarctica.AAC.2